MMTKFVRGFIKPLGRSLLVLTMLCLLGSTTPVDQAQSVEISLHVDTQTDSNDPAFQWCTNEPDDCSLRGAITRVNLDMVNDYLIQVPAGVYQLTLEGVFEDQNAIGDLDILGKVTLIGRRGRSVFYRCQSN